MPAEEQILKHSFISPENRTNSFVVRYQAGQRAWAEYTAQKTEEFIQAAAVYLAFPCPVSAQFTVTGRQEVWFTPAGSRQKVRIGGVHYPDRIELEYGLSPVGNPALLFHELAHYWFGDVFSVKDRELNWLMEGIVSFLPWALQQQGMLGLSDNEFHSFARHWGLYNSWDIQHDYPLEQDKRFEGPAAWRTQFYIKSFHIQYLLYLNLGRELYQQFLQELLKTPDVFKTNNQLMALLARLKKQDWQKVLTGWVFSGNYLLYQPVDFTDYDSDGLPGVTELLQGTSPVLADTDGDRLPDGFENSQGMNPLQADPLSVVQKFIPAGGLWADGLLTDWDFTGYQELNEPALAKESTCDLTGLRLTIRNGQLFVSLTTRQPLPRTEGIIVDLLIDLNGDREPEQEIAFELNRPDQPWLYLTRSRETRHFRGLDAGLGTGGCEFSIPLSLFSQNQFAVLPVIYHLKKKSNYDEWPSWVKLNLSLLTRLADYPIKTDLVDDDADQDGMPDLAELDLGFDPLTADGEEALTAYGPFVDGRGKEWQVLPAVRMSDEDKTEPAGPYDLQGLSYLIRRHTLYLFIPLLKVKNWSGTMEGLTCDVIIDLDQDRQADKEFVFYLTAPATPWLYTRITGKSTMPAALTTALDEGAEFAIPLDLIGNKAFYLYPVIWDMRKKSACDELPDWIKIDNNQ